MELCKPPGASGTALPAPCLIRLQNCTCHELTDKHRAQAL